MAVFLARCGGANFTRFKGGGTLHLAAQHLQALIIQRQANAFWQRISNQPAPLPPSAACRRASKVRARVRSVQVRSK